MNSLFTEIAESQASSVVGGESNTAELTGSIDASTGSPYGTVSTYADGNIVLTDNQSKVSFKLMASTNYSTPAPSETVG
jgi:hypothetical protein